MLPDRVAPDADIWHNFDDITQTVDDNIALMSAMTKRIADRRYVIRRLEPIEGGYLQQHTLELVLPDGRELSTEAVAIVMVNDDGLIPASTNGSTRPLAPLFA